MVVLLKMLTLNRTSLKAPDLEKQCTVTSVPVPLGPQPGMWQMCCFFLGLPSGFFDRLRSPSLQFGQVQATRRRRVLLPPPEDVFRVPGAVARSVVEEAAWSSAGWTWSARCRAQATPTRRAPANA